jgi:16S rRNA (guanine527-N7)-methyltransferase
VSRSPSSDALADELAGDRRAALRLVPVSRETEDRLAIFVALLDRWRHKTNLISIAIQLADVTGALVHCIESDGRKCAFLREAARATGAAAMIHPVRVEAIEANSLEAVDAVTARAFAPLPLTLEMARPWMERGAIAVFPRGESAKDQIAALPEASAYAIETLQSAVNSKAAILRIRQG